MMLNKERAVEALAESVRERTLVPFCGSGVSVRADPPLPTARDYLVEHGFDDHSWLEGTSQLARKANFKPTFNREFGKKNRHPSEQHRLLACLDAPFYVTTNYDDLLEKALRQFHHPVDNQVGVVNKNDVSEVFSYRNLVIKLHGDIESNELLVYTEKHYFDRIRQPNDVDAFVKLLFSTHTVLFVGYSVGDSNVLGMLGSLVESSSRNTPSKYALLNRVDERTRQRLEEYDVTPIDLDVDEDQYDEEACDFLYRLWEQNDYYGSYFKIIEKAPASVEETLAHAMTFRQNNQLAEARKHVKKLFPFGVEKLSLRQLPVLLWLVVSISDKLEEWRSLEKTDDEIIQPLFEQTVGKAHVRMSESLKAVYYSAMAIAFCRAGEYKKAHEYLTLAGDWRCTETADRGYQIVTANLLTAHALVLLHRSTELDDRQTLLQSACSKLEAAWSRYERYGELNTPEESHHLGRFYGTKVFLTLACVDAGLEPQWGKDIDMLRHDAKRAHSPEDTRTRFGQVAGLYCDAMCHYWLTKRFPDAEEVQGWIALAKERVAKALEGMDKKQEAVQLKLDMLRAQLSMNDREPTVQNTHYFSEDRLSCLPKSLRDKVNNDSKKWLSLPLN